MKTMNCVVRINTGHVLYEGRSEEAAARKLVPGTCYGWGRNPVDAAWKAKAERQKFQGGKR